MKIRKSESVGRFNELLASIDVLQASTSNLQNVLSKEAHLASRSNEPRIYSSLLFTDSPTYKLGRLRLVSKGKFAFQSREAADMKLYLQITSPKSSGVHISRSKLQSPEARRVMAKFRRQFGSQITNRKKPMRNLELDFVEKPPVVERLWRRQVNSYIDKYSKTKPLRGINPTFSLPTSPTRSPKIDHGKRVTFGPTNQASEILPESLNLQQEVLKAKSDLLEQRLGMSFRQRKHMERLNIRPN